VPGYTLVDAPNDVRFGHYAEINVNASQIWTVFSDLCVALIPDPATLIAAEDDIEPHRIVSADVSTLLRALERYQYQLSHDGFLQFGLVNDSPEEIAEVFVTPTKHFKVWLNDDAEFRSVMDKHELRECETIEFIDEYPRVTTRLPEGSAALIDRQKLWEHISQLVSGLVQ